MKTLKKCIQTLVRVACGDGNLLFNVGPMPTGQIEPRQVRRLEEMGRWLEKYGVSIYGTRGGPFIGNAWCASTHKDNRIYVHVLNWHSDTLRLPGIDRKIVQKKLLTGGDVEVKQSADEIVITVAREYQRQIDTIVVLELDASAAGIDPVEVPM
jgi:alpha-L-fucosidase